MGSQLPISLLDWPSTFEWKNYVIIWLEILIFDLGFSGTISKYKQVLCEAYVAYGIINKAHYDVVVFRFDGHYLFYIGI